MRLIPTLALLVSLGTGPLAAAPVHAFDPKDELGLRSLAEVGGGLLGSGVGILAGGGLGLVLCEAGGGSRTGWGCFGPLLIGAGIGGWWGMAGGIQVSGMGMGGNGGFGWELLGQASGTLVAGLLFWGLNEHLDADLFWWITWFALPLAGGIIGYELSNERTGADAVESRPAAFVMPLVLPF